MEKLLADTLTYLGANNKEIAFFLASYSLGTASINDIARAAKLERSTAYLIAGKLLQRGLLTEDCKPYNKAITAIEPEALLRMIAAKKRKLGRQELEIKENMPQLQNAYHKINTLPGVRVYDGVNGLLTIWRDVISRQQEILLWSNQETEGNIFTKKHHQSFIQDRLQRSIPLRVLAINNKKGSALQEHDTSCLRQTRLLPKDVSFSSETYIYGDKVAVLDFNRGIIGIVIESAEISGAQRAIFEMTWRQLSTEDAP